MLTEKDGIAENLDEIVGRDQQEKQRSRDGDAIHFPGTYIKKT